MSHALGDATPIPAGAGCREARLLLVPYLDGEATAAERKRVQEHLSTCNACRRVLDLYRQIGAALGALSTSAPGTAEPQPGLAGCVRLQVRRGRRRRWTLALSAAAAMVLIPSLIWWRSNAWSPVAGPAVTEIDKASNEQALPDLDILEAFRDEGIEPTIEIVDLLLEEPGGEEHNPGGEIVLLDLFEDFLEEEITGESL